jgi:hypothetical protein
VTCPTILRPLWATQAMMKPDNLSGVEAVVHSGVSVRAPHSSRQLRYVNPADRGGHCRCVESAARIVVEGLLPSDRGPLSVAD